MMRMAIVGTGPTGVYSFQHIIQSTEPLEIALFEQGDRLGVGMPYRADTASSMMLANIASIEIPPINESYLDWLRRLPAATLKSFHLDPATLDDRTFTPRLLLGQYFAEELEALMSQAEAKGNKVHRHPSCSVTDIQRSEGKLALTTDPALDLLPFDRVILATGHVFEEDDDLTDHYFPNPWSGLLDVTVPPSRIGIMGTSLSAIDAAMAVACQHGSFIGRGEALRYETEVAGTLNLTLMSWTGILPEADFYCPIPYNALKIMTPEALQATLSAPQPMSAVFDLVKAEISSEDPAWARSIGLETLDLEGFVEAYFKDRKEHDPFDWAEANLAEVEANKIAKKTVAWRYAILRMHEAVEDIVPDLPEADRERFDQGLKKVFVDNYAAVPSESIRRLLALRRAGVLSILALGHDYDMTHEEGFTRITAEGEEHIFDIFIDARGQKPMTSEDVPFPSLRQDLLAAGQETPEIGADYGLTGVDGYEGKLYFASLPYLMADQPFVQGITACAEIGEIVARSEARRRKRRKRAA